jgi:dolichol kinase
MPAATPGRHSPPITHAFGPDAAPRPASGSWLWRRLFHILAGSTYPFALIWAPQDPLAWSALGLTSLVVLVEVVRFQAGPINRWLTGLVRPLMKEREHRAVFGSTWVLIATVIVLFTMDQPVAVLALFYLSLGDPAAAAVGERWGRHRLLGKSIEGSAAFLAAAFAIGSLLVGATLDTTYAVMAVGALAAMAAELAPLPLDDNLKVPLAAGGVMTLAAHFWT